MLNALLAGKQPGPGKKPRPGAVKQSERDTTPVTACRRLTLRGDNLTKSVFSMGAASPMPAAGRPSRAGPTDHFHGPGLPHPSPIPYLTLTRRITGIWRIPA